MTHAQLMTVAAEIRTAMVDETLTTGVRLLALLQPLEAAAVVAMLRTSDEIDHRGLERVLVRYATGEVVANG